MLAGTWYLDPGSKSVSDLSTGGFTPPSRSLKKQKTKLVNGSRFDDGTSGVDTAFGVGVEGFNLSSKQEKTHKSIFYIV